MNGPWTLWRRGLLLGGIAVTSTLACSLIVTFDEENRPCAEDADGDGNGDCLDGYACMIDVCVRNRSVPVGETCSVNTHCVHGAVCTTAPFVCREACENPFGARDCSASSGCAPISDAGGVIVGACRPGECTTTCTDSTEVCALAKGGVGFCLDGCAITCPGGVCGGLCSPDPDTQARQCNLVGQNQVLACMPQGLRPHGSGCDLTSLHCAQGATCALSPDGSYGVCLQYCDPLAASPCGNLLDPATGGSADCEQLSGRAFGLCGSLPATPGDDGAPGGDPGPPASAAGCLEHCTAMGQCAPGFSCLSGACRPCGVSADCVPHVSGWQGRDTNGDFLGDTVCATDAECGAPQVCLSYQSQGFCAFPSAGLCFGGATEQSVARVEGGNATVCRNDIGACDANACVLPCYNNPGCWGQYAATCDGDPACSLLSNQTCIGVGGGQGRCFTDADLAGSCTAPESQMQATHVDGSTPKQICADTGSTCNASTNRCETAALSCPNDYTCSGETPDCVGGRCVCNGSSCNAGGAHPTCNLTVGTCECEVSTTCEDNLAHRHLGTTWTCQ